VPYVLKTVAILKIRQCVVGLITVDMVDVAAARIADKRIHYELVYVVLFSVSQRNDSVATGMSALN